VEKVARELLRSSQSFVLIWERVAGRKDYLLAGDPYARRRKEDWFYADTSSRLNRRGRGRRFRVGVCPLRYLNRGLYQTRSR